MEFTTETTIFDVGRAEAVGSNLSTAEILYVAIAVMVAVCILLGVIYACVQKKNKSSPSMQWRVVDPEVAIKNPDEANEDSILPPGSIQTKITPVLKKEPEVVEKRQL